MRPISAGNFNRIISLGLAENADLLPRIGKAAPSSLVQEERVPFVFEQERDRVLALTSRPVRALTSFGGVPAGYAQGL